MFEVLWTDMQSITNITRNTTTNSSGRCRRLAQAATFAIAATAAIATFGASVEATGSACGTSQSDDTSLGTFGGFTGGVRVATGDIDSDAAAATTPTTTTPFSFGVEREMKESGEQGGTADINIGVGELQECTISKSMDSTSVSLAQYAINGNSAGATDTGDYSDWQSNYGTTADGDVDGRDFLAWQTTRTADSSHDKWIVIESMSSPIFR